MQATSAARGRVLAGYVAAAQLGCGAGHALFGAVGSSPVVVTAVAILGHMAALALVPSVGPARAEHASPVSVGPPAPRAAVPFLAAAGCVTSGLLGGALTVLAPLWGAGVGFAGPELALLLGAMVGGALSAQWPIGMLADRAGRPRALLVLAMLGLGPSLLLTVGAPRTFAVVLVPMAMLGASYSSLYAVASAHANDRAGPGAAPRTATTLMLLYSVAAWGGCAVAGFAMSTHGPDALFAYCAAGCAALAAIAAAELIRVSAGPRLAPAIAFVVASSPVGCAADRAPPLPRGGPRGEPSPPAGRAPAV